MRYTFCLLLYYPISKMFFPKEKTEIKELKPEIKEENDEEVSEDNFEEGVFEYDTKSCCLKLKEKCTIYSNQAKTKFQNSTC